MRALFNRLTYGFASFTRLRYGRAVFSRLRYGFAVFGGSIVRPQNFLQSQTGQILTAQSSGEALSPQ